MNTENKTFDNQEFISKDEHSEEQLVTDPQLIEYLNGLQQQKLLPNPGNETNDLNKITIDSCPNYQSKTLTLSTYRSVLKKHDVRDKAIERILKCIVNNRGDDAELFSRMYLNLPTGTAEPNIDSTDTTDMPSLPSKSNDVSSYVKSTHDKLVIKFYRKYGIYDILIYNHNKDHFSFLIFPINGAMMEMTIPVKQTVASDASDATTTKIGIRQVIGILIASIIKNVS